MHRLFVRALSKIAVVSFGLAALSPQARAQELTPLASNVRGAKYPAIDRDNRVTFRIKAPQARLVEARGRGSLWGGKPFPLTKDNDGTWMGTSPPAEPGFFYYELGVDGVGVNDPASETFYGWAHESSGLEIPEQGVDFYLPKRVPHGEVRERNYFSRVTQANRRALVYTPPGYDRDTR